MNAIIILNFIFIGLPALELLGNIANRYVVTPVITDRRMRLNNNWTFLDETVRNDPK